MTVRFQRIIAGRFFVATFLAFAAMASDAAAPHGRFSASGYVRDNVTGLVWVRTVDPINVTWDAARTYCTDSVKPLPGVAPWRLPTVKELQTIVDSRFGYPAIDGAAFPDTPATLFWSSTPDVSDTSSAWGVSFGDGSSKTIAKVAGGLVRCVR